LGKIVIHPKEYKTLLLIQKLWLKGMNPNAISTQLNRQRIPSRMAKQWSWNAVKNIVDRLKKKQIPLEEQNHEPR
jgi:recombinase